jgi:hypothetical protein
MIIPKNQKVLGFGKNHGVPPRQQQDANAFASMFREAFLFPEEIFYICPILNKLS